MQRIFALIACLALPFTAQAMTASDVEFVNDVILVHNIETVDDLVRAVPDFVTVEELNADSEDRQEMIEVELRADDDVVEGVINPNTATLELFADPDALGCAKVYTGLTMCISHYWWVQYCWTGGWWCTFMGCGWDVLGSCY